MAITLEELLVTLVLVIILVYATPSFVMIGVMSYLLTTHPVTSHYASDLLTLYRSGAGRSDQFGQSGDPLTLPKPIQALLLNVLNLLRAE